MTGWISGTKIDLHGTEREVHYWPPPDSNRTYVNLNEMYPDKNGATDLEFHVTSEGMIINITDLNGEIIGTSSETFEEIVERLCEEL